MLRYKTRIYYSQYQDSLNHIMYEHEIHLRIQLRILYRKPCRRNKSYKNRRQTIRWKKHGIVYVVNRSRRDCNRGPPTWQGALLRSGCRGAITVLGADPCLSSEIQMKTQKCPHYFIVIEGIWGIYFFILFYFGFLVSENRSSSLCFVQGCFTFTEAALANRTRVTGCDNLLGLGL